MNHICCSFKLIDNEHNYPSVYTNIHTYIHTYIHTEYSDGVHTRCARCILCTILPSPWNEWYHCYIIILGLWNKVNKTLISSLQVLLVIIYSFYRIRCSLYNTLSTLFKFIMANKVHSWEWLVLSRRPRCQHDIYEYCFPTLADASHVLNPCLALIRHRSWHFQKVYVQNALLFSRRVC